MGMMPGCSRQPRPGLDAALPPLRKSLVRPTRSASDRNPSLALRSIEDRFVIPSAVGQPIFVDLPLLDRQHLAPAADVEVGTSLGGPVQLKVRVLRGDPGHLAGRALEP